MFVNVHSFYLNEKPESIARRSLETFAVAKWADLRKKSLFSFTRELEASGDIKTLSEIMGSAPATIIAHYQHVSHAQRIKTVSLIPPLDPPDPRDPVENRKGAKIVDFVRNKKKRRKNAK